MGKNSTLIFYNAALALLFLFYFYGPILIHPNHYLFGSHSDGIKNYYTYAYFIKNNDSAIELEGFNHPYGEHFTYTDGIPVLAWTIKSLSTVFPKIIDHQIGILNFSMILSILIGSFFVLKILLMLDVSKPLASLGAFGIMILAPQVFRFGGHYALSYAFFIPITLYLLFLHHMRNQRGKYVFWIFLNGLLWFFVHPYLGMISTSLAFLFLLSRAIGKPAFSFPDLIHSVVVFSPVLIFYAFIKLTDFHEGRSDNPYGFFTYYADFDTVFLPNHGPLNSITNRLLPRFEQTWEGWSYIGIFAILSGILLLVNLFRNRKFSVKNTLNTNHVGFLKYSLISSLILLFFSFGYPFRYGFESFVEYIPLFKQFRTIGRFSWVFYFTVNASAIYFIDRLIKTSSNSILSSRIGLGITFGLIACLFVMESYAPHKEVANLILNPSNEFDSRQLSPDVNAIVEKTKDLAFQAIIPLPYYNIGSENFEVKEREKICRSSMLLSYHLGLPLLANYAARTSITESKKSVQVISPEFYKKEIESDISSDLPFLILTSGESLSKYETALLQRGENMGTYGELGFFKITREALFKNTSDQEVREFVQLEPTFYSIGNLRSPDSLLKTLFYDFENIDSEISRNGSGAFSVKKSGVQKILSFQTNALQYDQQHVLSFWIYNKGQDRLNNMNIMLTETSGNRHLQEVANKPLNSLCIDGDWSLIELDFVPKQPNSEFILSLKSLVHSNIDVYLDDVLIYPESAIFYRLERDEKGDTVVFKGNHLIGSL